MTIYKDAVSEFVYPVPFTGMSKTTINSGVGANPQTAHELNADYESGAIIKNNLSPSTRVHDLCYDHVRDCIWGVTRSDTAINYVFKVAQDGTMTETALGGSGTYKSMGIIYADNYLWVAVLGTPAKLLKIDPADATITEYTMGSGENDGTNVAYDGTYIYMTLFTSAGKIIKFNPATETHTTITTTGAVGLYWCDFDGRYVWANGNVGAPGTNCALVKLDTTDDSYTVKDMGALITDTHEIAFDGHYLWIGGWGESQIIRYDPVADTTTIMQTPSRLPLVMFDGKQIWAVGGSTVYTINPTTFAMKKMLYDTDNTYAHGLVFDGRHIWLSNWQDTAYIWKIPAYMQSIGGESILAFDGGQTDVVGGTTRYIDTNSVNATENVTQIPIIGNYKFVGLAAEVLVNTCDAASGIRLRKNGGDYAQYIVYAAGETGTKNVIITDNVFFTSLDLVSIKVWAGGSGSIRIGKISVILQG